MTAINQNISFDALNDIVDKYNNAVHKLLKWNLLKLRVILMPNITKNLIKKNPKFKVGDNVRISKYKNVFAKGYTPNWSEEDFINNKIKNIVPWTYAISDLNDEEITESFYGKELKKTSQKEFRIEKVLKRKGDKLYVKWKGYNNSFNSWINKNDLI